MNKKLLRKIIFAVLLIGSLGLIIFLSSLIYILTHAYINTAKKSDAILVLGAAVTNEGYPCLQERVNHAANLYQQGLAPKIVFAGGKLPVDYDIEANVAKRLGISDHIPESSMLLEGNSHNTYEDMLFSKAILDQNNLHTIIIVTDPLHEPRAALLAQKDGISYTLSPATQSSCTTQFPKNLKLLFHETVGIIYYKLLNRI